jgi:hypothetical protein
MSSVRLQPDVVADLLAVHEQTINTVPRISQSATGKAL